MINSIEEEIVVVSEDNNQTENGLSDETQLINDGENPQNIPILGISMAISSGIIFAVGSLTVALLPNVNPFEIYAIR